eukprot:836847-Rhodomonas_salina.4
MLSKHRVNNKREFFDISKATAVRVLQVFYEQMLKGEIQGCSEIEDAREPFWGTDPDWVNKLEQEVDLQAQLQASQAQNEAFKAKISALESENAWFQNHGE